MTLLMPILEVIMNYLFFFSFLRFLILHVVYSKYFTFHNTHASNSTLFSIIHTCIHMANIEKMSFVK